VLTKANVSNRAIFFTVRPPVVRKALCCKQASEAWSAHYRLPDAILD
jgi:hypothetical protein